MEWFGMNGWFTLEWVGRLDRNTHHKARLISFSLFTSTILTLYFNC
jgi:hypothetical protein